MSVPPKSNDGKSSTEIETAQVILQMMDRSVEKQNAIAKDEAAKARKGDKCNQFLGILWVLFKIGLFGGVGLACGILAGLKVAQDKTMCLSFWKDWRRFLFGS